MKITAVVPVRKGSQRVINKNLKKFAQTSLLENKINTLKKVVNINEIIVNTDSDEAIEIAKNLGVSYHKREAYYASSECGASDFFKHLGEVTDTDLFAYCPPTSPFIKSSTIEQCIREFLLNAEYDSFATVSNVKHFLWLNNEPINYKREFQPNSQDLPNIVSLNFGLNLISKEMLLLYKNIVGIKPLFRVLDQIEAIDIDTELDFFIAEQISNSYLNY